MATPVNLAKLFLFGLCVILVFFVGRAAAMVVDSSWALALPVDAEQKALFARVDDDITISLKQFDERLAQTARQRFFHGSPDKVAQEALRLEVAVSLIDEALINRAALLAAKAAGAQMAGELLIDSLRQSVMALGAPDEAAVRRYYEANADKFTTPEQLHVAVILLAVAPWAPAASWQGADDEAARLKKLLEGGADFASLATQHSSDSSAAKGGDLGWMHHGMLAEPVQLVVDQLLPGELSKPVRLLQGIALFRLQARNESTLNDFTKVRERAQGLLIRELGQQRWTDYVGRLRAAAIVWVNPLTLTVDGS